MRKRFERQIDLGQTPIEEVELPLQSRDELPPILAGLQWIFTTQQVSEEIFTVLEKKVTGDKKETGRQGMDLWHILVLGVVRLGLGCDYDRMEHLANYDMLIRQIMGLKTDLWQQGHKNFHGKTISENICHIDEELLEQINDIVMSHGRKLFKKKTGEKVAIKLDSYVLESNVHFPTDYNLLWDCNRKCIELLSKLKAQLVMSGWRKEKVWLRQLKNQMRAIGRVSHRGGANKEKRLKTAATANLDKSRKLGEKVAADLKELKRFCVSEASLCAIVEIEYYYKCQQHQIDLFYRRVIEGETIPAEEKIYSVFEAHTEWINKGKSRPSVELGHRLQIGTDQYKLIIDYKVLEKESEVDQPLPTVERILSKLDETKLGSLSTDKGYSRKADREELEALVEKLVIPKKGRKNKQEQERESEKSYLKLKHKHSAVESEINSLEHHGLNRCPDKGLDGYKRYVGLGVLSYNLHQIGKQIQEQKRAALKKRRKCA